MPQQQQQAMSIRPASHQEKTMPADAVPAQSIDILAGLSGGVVAVQTASQPKLPTMDQYSFEQKLKAHDLLFASGIAQPSGKVPNLNERVADLETTLRQAVEDGSIPIIPAALLKVRGYPQPSPSQDVALSDQARELAAQLAQFAKLNGERTIAGWQCPNNIPVKSCTMRPITDPQIRTALNTPLNNDQKSDTAPFSEKRTRAIPVDQTGALVFSAVDAIMNAPRYTGGEDIVSFAASHPVDKQKEIDAVAKKGTLEEARVTGARLGLQILAETGMRYNGSQFLGRVETPQRLVATGR